MLAVLDWKFPELSYCTEMAIAADHSAEMQQMCSIRE
jgi:hypothetical protein